MKLIINRGLLLLILLTLASNASALERKADWAKYGRSGTHDAATNGDTTPDNGELDLISYSIGMSIGEDIKSRGIPVNADILARGVEDIINGNETAISKQEAMQILAQLQEQLASLQREEMERIIRKNTQAGQAFLADNARRDGVIVTDSGLQYEILSAGAGATPALDDIVVVDYRGTFIEGKEFDSSYQRGEPVEFSVKGIIPGWTEALIMMKEGAKWRLFIPADLAYGLQGAPPVIEPGTTLVFEVELKEIQR